MNYNRNNIEYSPGVNAILKKRPYKLIFTCTALLISILFILWALLNYITFNKTKIVTVTVYSFPIDKFLSLRTNSLSDLHSKEMNIIRHDSILNRVLKPIEIPLSFTDLQMVANNRHFKKKEISLIISGIEPQGNKNVYLQKNQVYEVSFLDKRLNTLTTKGRVLELYPVRNQFKGFKMQILNQFHTTGNMNYFYNYETDMAIVIGKQSLLNYVLSSKM